MKIKNNKKMETSMEKRKGLTQIWEKIEAIKVREATTKFAATASLISNTIKQKINNFDDFIDGKFAEDKVSFLGETYDEKFMIDYVNELPEIMKKDNRSWLSAMANDEVFMETLDICPKLLSKVFDEEKQKGYEGLPVSFTKLMKVQNSIPALKFLSKGELLVNISKSDNLRELDLDKVTKVITQSQKNIDVILNNAKHFDNIHQVFEKHPNLIKVLDQQILVDKEKAPKILAEIDIAAKNNSKVRNFADFYLSFFMDDKGNILEVQSKADKVLESTDPMSERRKKAMENIKNVTGKTQEKNHQQIYKPKM